MIGAWGADHTDRFWHHPSASPAVIMWKWWVNIFFLNIIPNNSTARTGHKVWCNRGMSDEGVRPPKAVWSLAGWFLLLTKVETERRRWNWHENEKIWHSSHSHPPSLKAWRGWLSSNLMTYVAPRKYEVASHVERAMWSGEGGEPVEEREVSLRRLVEDGNLCVARSASSASH